MRVLIAEERPDIRRALKILLETQPDLDVVGEAINQAELLLQAKTTCPGLVLLDNTLINEQMDKLIPTLHNFECKPAVIVLSVRAEVEQPALNAGADAFVLKGAPPKTLLIAIEAIRLR